LSLEHAARLQCKWWRRWRLLQAGALALALALVSARGLLLGVRCGQPVPVRRARVLLLLRSVLAAAALTWHPSRGLCYRSICYLLCYTKDAQKQPIA
jgi:hypothetical protein